MSFQLLEIKVRNNEKIIIDVNFTNENKTSKEPLTTVILGINGAGKSYLLSIICDVFRFLDKEDKFNKLKYEYYYIRYLLNNETYDIEIINNKIINCQNEHYKNPQKILAISYMINDKFPFVKFEESLNMKYEYLGMRQVSNGAWTNGIEKRVFETFVNNIDDKEFLKNLKSIFDFLNINPTIEFKFEPQTKSLFDKEIKYKDLVEKIERLSKSNSMKAYRARGINKDELIELVEFINSKKITEYVESSKKIYSLEYEFNFENLYSNNIENFKYEYRIISKLINLKIIKSPHIYISKEYGDTYKFDDSSSGEQQMLFTLISLAGKIKENSLILIDEPEISIHPGWQMEYIELIKRIFKNYNSCHFIISTHSHYLVSSLKKISSSLVLLDKDSETNTIKAHIPEYDTYAWSAENILLKIFNVKTCRNYYIADYIDKILLEMSSGNILYLKSQINELEDIYSALVDADPLKDIVRELIKKGKN
ncbi:AAA family ATPase [Paraclostridium bifermentans]|uniref:AAA family ATPase n=1 Tax=Paraclostridium bifermentans TaxID=1490 RepID=UPI00387B7E67